jgi:MYXO-CTERM domain-containing protein
VLVPGASDSLRVLASADGTSWTEVDRLTGMGTGWQRRMIRLADTLPPEALAAKALRFRFVAEDAEYNTVVEAVIDDVGLLGETAACAIAAPDGGTMGVGVTPPPGGGCGCRLGGGREPAVPALLVVGAIWCVRRRRARPR